MAYSHEIITRAAERLAALRAERESEYRARLAQCYSRIPQVQQIDLQMRRNMAEAARAAFSQGAADAIEAARKENQALAARREELLRGVYPEGWLQEQPVCGVCGGTGYLGSAMCGCLAELCRQEQKKALGSLTKGTESFANFRLDYYSDRYEPAFRASPRSVMEKVLANCRRYAAGFTENAGNLLFIGNTGLGKTYLAACIAAEVADKGYGVVYEPAASLFSKLERARFSPSEENQREADRIRNAQLLIIDDLGTEMPGQFVTAALYSLLNERLLEQLPMIITTNLTVEEAGQRYSPQIASRLYGEFSRLTFVGSDIRVLRGKA